MEPRKDMSSISVYFSEYTESQIDEMLSNLAPEELTVLHNRYGQDFKHLYPK